jgi:hypothetical protein
MMRFWKHLRQAFNQPARPARPARLAARRAQLSVECLEGRDLMSISPLALYLQAPVSPVPIYQQAQAPPSVSPTGPAFNVASVGEISSSRTVAQAANGNFAVVWDSQDPQTGGVYYSLYDAGGNLLATSQIDNNPADSQATVAMDRNGDFAVAWQVAGQGANNEILAQRFDANGGYVGGFNLVSSFYYNYDPSIALNDNGQLAVAYNQNPGDGNVYVNLWCQGGVDQPGSYFAAGFSSGAPSPSIALNDNNQGVLAYTTDDATGTSIMGIYAFSPQSGVQDGRLLLHSGPTAYTDRDPSVAINASGEMLVAYTNVYTSDGDGIHGSIVDQQVEVVRYTSDFTLLGDQHVLAVTGTGVDRWGPLYNSYSSLQYRPSAALDDAGNFVVTARQELYKTDYLTGDTNLVSTSVVGQVFASDGSALTTAFSVGSVQDNPALHTQDYPSVAVDNNGNFVVTWQDSPPVGSNELMAMQFAY